MSSNKEIVQQQIVLLKESIHEERRKERLTAHPSVMLPRLLDGLGRSENSLKKLQEK